MSDKIKVKKLLSEFESSLEKIDPSHLNLKWLSYELEKIVIYHYYEKTRVKAELARLLITKRTALVQKMQRYKI